MRLNKPPKNYVAPDILGNQESLLYKIVCSPSPKRNVMWWAQGELCGTRHGWSLDDDKPNAPAVTGCDEPGNKSKHYRFVC
jgi:hypothetical protein